MILAEALGLGHGCVLPRPPLLDRHRFTVGTGSRAAVKSVIHAPSGAVVEQVGADLGQPPPVRLKRQPFQGYESHERHIAST